MHPRSIERSFHDTFDVLVDIFNMRGLLFDFAGAAQRIG